MSSTNPAGVDLGARASELWKRLAPRERLAVVLAAAVLVLGLGWMVLVAPALRTLREAPLTLDRLDVQLQQMQRLAAEARELKALPPVSAGQSANALRAASERLGDQAKLALQGDRATLTLTGISGEKLRQWLSEARSGARARVVDAQLSRGAQGYNGSIVVTFGGAS